MDEESKEKKVIKNSFKFPEVITIIFITLVVGIIIGYAVTTNFKDDDVINNKALKEFINTYNDVKDNYYKDIDDNTLINGAISGMLSALDDPYTSYISESETDDFNDSISLPLAFP